MIFSLLELSSKTCWDQDVKVFVHIIIVTRPHSLLFSVLVSGCYKEKFPWWGVKTACISGTQTIFIGWKCYRLSIEIFINCYTAQWLRSTSILKQEIETDFINFHPLTMHHTPGSCIQIIYLFAFFFFTVCFPCNCPIFLFSTFPK